MIKKCEYCNKEFTPAKNHNNQRFCSKSCGARAHRKENIGLFRDDVPDCIKKYIIGLVATDGCITDNHHASKIIRICLNEFDVIKMVNAIVAPDRKLYRTGKNYQVAWLNSRDVEMFESLGITERKSFTVPFINFDANMWHYIIGVFDGDGCVYYYNLHDKKYGRVYRYTIVTISSASLEFANGINDFLNTNGIHSKITRDSRDRVMYYVRISRQADVALFAEKIYEHSGMWRLARKYNKFYETK